MACMLTTRSAVAHAFEHQRYSSLCRKVTSLQSYQKFPWALLGHLLKLLVSVVSWNPLSLLQQASKREGSKMENRSVLMKTFPMFYAFSHTSLSDSDFMMDTILSNAIILIRNAIWWCEECLATAAGDTSRILEIFKVFAHFMLHFSF